METPGATWIILHADGTLTSGGAPVAANEVDPEIVFVSNDVFYGPIKECAAMLEAWPSVQ